ncbi:MAG: hypothetical protein HY830_16105 [Actinobacteria bacterium]|nr:hypothetical protein [Actinomycetota bacterium]
MTGEDRDGALRAFERARAAGDVEAMATAAFMIAAVRPFGAPLLAPGYLHEAYLSASGATAARLAVELARCWAYAGEPARAAPFADEALAVAERMADPVLEAAALDAELLVHWGPDDLSTRIRTSSRLEGLAGRLTDPQTRLSAALWRLTTALESLDVVTVRRQLRVLDALAEESGSPRVQMFAASRRGMYALVVGDLDTAATQVTKVRRCGEAASEPDTEALVHVLTSGLARQKGDRAALAAEAADFEAFGTAHGIRSVLAEAALFWLEAGEADRAGALLDQVVAGGLDAVTRDVDWALTVATATEVAAGVGNREVAEAGRGLLEPYAGRGVVNAGGVAFVGVVEDYLRITDAVLGRERDPRWTAGAATGYRRLGARWWLERLQSSTGGARPGPVSRVVLAPSGDDLWLVGAEGRASTLRAVKGFRYLHLLLSRPGAELSALELSAAVNGNAARPTVAQSDLGPALDRRALSEYRRRIAELDEELEQTRAWADHGRSERAVAERDLLLAEIAAATGLGGRPRPAGADAERARMAVQKAVTAALQRIEQLEPSIARLLRDTIRTGATCSYHPDPDRPVTWVLGPLRP